MPRNFFQLYDKLTDKTEPAKIYHLWGAISVIANIAGKKIWLPMGHFNIYPNLYLLFVGVAGNRKTTALDFSEKYFALSGVSSVADTSTTSEAVIETMASTKARIEFQYNKRMYSYQQYSPYCSEFNTFLGGKHINEGLVKFLTDIYDKERKYTYKTKNKGEYGIENPFFSFAGACTIGWFLDNLKGGLISSGFARRIIFINSDHYFPIAIPELPEDYPMLIEELALEMKRVQALSGPMTLAPGTIELYKSLYPKWMEQANSAIPALQPYFSTKHVQVFKAAMACSLGLGNSLVIEPETYKLVVRMFDELEVYYPSLFAASGDNLLMKYTAQIISEIQKYPQGVKASTILGKFWGDVDTQSLNEIVEVLRKTGRITIVNNVIKASEAKIAAKDNYLLRPLGELVVSQEQQVCTGNYPIQIAPVLKKSSGVSLKVSKEQVKKLKGTADSEESSED